MEPSVPVWELSDDGVVVVAIVVLVLIDAFFNDNFRLLLESFAFDEYIDVSISNSD